MLQNPVLAILLGTFIVCLATTIWGIWIVFFRKQPMRPLEFQRSTLGHRVFLTLTVVGFDQNVMQGEMMLVLRDEKKEEYFVRNFPHNFTTRMIGTSLVNVKLQKIIFPGIWELVSWDEDAL